MRDDVLIFDLETDSVDRLYDDVEGFVRIAAYAWGDGPVTVTDDIDELVAAIGRATLVVGHNLLGFDLPALQRYHGLDADRLVEQGRVVDLLVVHRQVDPPLAQGRDKGRYGLDALGHRLLGEGKLTEGSGSALKALATEFGGYGAIPTDDPRYRAYASQDVELTRAIAAHPMTKVDDYVRREHRVLWRLGVMERVGVRIDVAAANRALDEHRQRRNELLETLHERYGVPRTGKASPHATEAGREALGVALQGMGVEPPRTSTGKLALGKERLAALAEEYSDNSELQELVAVLRGIGEQTFAEQALKHLRPDGRVHPSVSAEQATGRLSITQPALTTAGKRSDRLVAQRAVVVPDCDDEVLLSADLSGIDAAALALVSGDPAYIEAAAGDYHNTMAQTVFGDCGWDGTGNHPRRSEAKVLVHGINYGMGARAAAAQAGVSVLEAEDVIRRLDAVYEVLALWRRRMRTEAQEQQVLTTAAGRRVRFTPGREWTQAPAFMGQSTARDLLAAGVLSMPEWLAARIRLIVHDEIVVSVPKDRVDDAARELVDSLQLRGKELRVVEGAPVVRLRAEASQPGENWAACYVG
ncbi:DNA polymerase [Gordonia amicalis]|uniref:DNA polymerase n=1 Tax=Gordonia amicalis TaxID=89053 RepID=A0AAE4R4Z7_9ACTN|nr:DNA polymerase [Gordonia amicalis]MDV6312097.1 DNA polymerase [Gordonia amicalis]